MVERRKRMNKHLIKAAILSISILTVMAGAAVSPALADIQAAFPNSSETTIKLILTLPSLFIIPFTFISSYLTKKIAKKTIVLIGISFYVVGGAGGGLAASIEWLLVCRAVLGIGVGFLMPISTSLVSDFFDGRERTAVMGQVSASNNLGGIILFLSSGMLAAISWRVTFSVYLVALLVALIVVWFLPKRSPETIPIGTSLAPLPKKVYLLGGGLFFLILAFYSIPANMALFIHEEGIGSSQMAGIIIAIATATGLVAGIVLNKVNQLLNAYVIPSQLFLMAAGFLLVGFSNHLVFLAAGVACMGFGFGIIMPIVFDRVTREVPRIQVVQAMALVTSLLFLGQFASPIVLDGIGMMANQSSIRFIYQFVGTAMLIVSLAYLFIAYRVKDHSHLKEERS
jgi:MFS family permease